VDLNGNIARLESLETPSQSVESAEINASVSDKKRKHPDSADLPMSMNGKEGLDLPTLIPTNSMSDNINSSITGKHPLEVHETNWDSCMQDLTNLIGETSAQELVSFLRYDETDDASDKFYTLPAISDKEVRRSIHLLIKTPVFRSIACADNADGRIRVWRKRFESDMPADTHSGGRGRGNNNNSGNNDNGSHNRRGAKCPPWPKDRPDFLRFVLYKENVDTTTAVKDVVRMARLPPKRGINYAGMKDKRGITTQFCSVYRVEKEQLLTVNREITNSSGGGNTTLNGSNIIRLGNFHYSSDEVKLGALAGNRFDVVLRNIDIGEDSVSISCTRKQQVQQKLEGAGNALKAHGFINYFGMQRFGKYYDTHLVGIAIMKGDFERAIDIIMEEKPDEYPRIAEARRRWATRFESINVSTDENSARQAEMKCARDIQNSLGRFMNCENSIVSSLSRNPRDYKRAFGSIAKNMRSMFLHAYQSYLWNMVASHRVESGGSTEIRVGDLVLTEDKPTHEGGGGTSGLKGKAVKIIDEQDLMETRYSITDVVLPLAGSKIKYPGGSSGDFFDELLKKDGIGKSDFARIGTVDREIALCGDYRKLICKPENVSFEIRVYQDPLQPLLQTDLMKVKNIDVAAMKLCSSDEQNLNQEVDQEDSNEMIFGMSIGFSLPPSSYATIALRELTKRSTSSEYQSKLQLSGAQLVTTDRL
jgi:tRNA pseudouridine13 synthase